MINKIGFNNLNSINFTAQTSLLDKFKQEFTIQPEEVKSEIPALKGSEALGSYNQASIQIANPLEQYIIKDIPKPHTLKGGEAEATDGEKVLDSDGKLVAVVKKEDKTTTETFFEDNGKSVSQIITKDNNTGFKIKEEDFYNGLSHNITEFSADTGKKIKETSFLQGKIFYVTAIDEKNNNEISNKFSHNGSLSSIELKDTKTQKKTEYWLNEKNEIQDSTDYDENYNATKRTQYKNGLPEKTSITEYKPIKNSFGITPDNITLKPHVFVEKPDVTKLEGEKKVRSNSTLESLTVTNDNKKTVYKMAFDGKDVESIEESVNDIKTKTVSFFNDGNSQINEFEKGKESTRTGYDKDGTLESVSKTSENGNSEYFSYSKEGYIKDYHKYTKEEGMIRLDFDKDKNLISANVNNPDEKEY